MSLASDTSSFCQLLDTAQRFLRQDSRQALTYAERAVAWAQVRGEPYQVGKALRVRGMAQGSSGNIQAATADLTHALALARKSQNRTLQAQCLTGLGTAAHHQGNVADALQYGYQAVELWRTLNDPSGLLLSLNNLAAFHGTRGDYNKTIAFLAEALQLVRESGDHTEEAMVLGNIALVHLECGQPEDAIAHFESGMALYAEYPNPIGQANTLVNYAKALHLAERPLEAVEAAQRALQLAQHEENSLLEAKALVALGRTLPCPDRAASALDRAYQLAQERGLPEPLLMAAYAKGRFALQHGTPEEALSWLHKALALAEESKRLFVLSEIHATFSDTYEALGNLSEALRHHKEFHRLCSQLHKESAEHRLVSENARQEAERLRHQALEDPLTQLYNRRYLSQYLESELARARRHQLSLSVILIDIDDFKQVNDTFSHRTGDQVLVRVAQLLQQVARRSDVLVRQSGDEFLVIAPETALPQAQEVAERTRVAIQEHPWHTLAPELTITVSIGVADLLHGEDLLDSADRRLYQAKRSGKNRLAA